MCDYHEEGVGSVEGRQKTREQLMAELSGVRRRLAESEHRRQSERSEIAAAERERTQQQLREVNVRTSAILDAIPDVIAVTDANGAITAINPAAAEQLGRPVDEAIGAPIWNYFPAEVAAATKNCVLQVITTKEPFRFEELGCDGAVRDWAISPLFGERGTVAALVIVVRDITGGCKVNDEAEQERRKTEGLLAVTLRSIGDAVIATDCEGHVSFMNATAEELTGWRQDEATGRPLQEIFDIRCEETDDRVENPVERVLKEGSVVGLANHTKLMRRGGGELPIADSAAPIRNDAGRIVGIVLVFQDLTERRKTEKVVIELRQKELMLKEVHHRIKNNLQVISSMLDLTTMRVQQPEAVASLEDARSLIHTMALIHNQLYRSEGLGAVDMRTYVPELMGYLSRVHSDTGTNIIGSADSTDVVLSMNQAMPFALVLSELISNACKHAFRGRKDGTIEVSLRSSPDGTIVASVKDDGVGFPADVDIHTANTLGMKLVRNLIYRQLKGTTWLERGAGTSFWVSFAKASEES